MIQHSRSAITPCEDPPDGIMSESPCAEALLMTGLGRWCFRGEGPWGTCTLGATRGAAGAAAGAAGASGFSSTGLSSRKGPEVSRPSQSSSPEEGVGRVSAEWVKGL